MFFSTGGDAGPNGRVGERSSGMNTQSVPTSPWFGKDAFQLPPMRPEMRFLYGIARNKLPAPVIDNLNELLRQGLDWRFLTEIASEHGLWPLLNQHLDHLQKNLIPSDVLKFLRETADDWLALARIRVGDLHRLLEAFQRAGLDLIPYKGPVLGEKLYGNYAQRIFSDLDFLVQPQEVQPACSCLTAQGFRHETAVPPGWEDWFEANRHEHAFSHPTSGLYVELHWRPWQSFFGMPVDVRPFWRHRENICLEGKEISTLRTEALLFILCLHGTKHQWNRLAWLVDVSEILHDAPSLEWSRIWPLAEESHSEGFLSIGLLLARQLLSAPLPQDTIRRIHADRRGVRMAWEIGCRLISGVRHTVTEREYLYFLFRALSSWRDRLRFLWGVATEPCRDDWNFCLLPPRLNGLYAMLRPCRLIGVATRKLTPCQDVHL